MKLIHWVHRLARVQYTSLGIAALAFGCSNSSGSTPIPAAPPCDATAESLLSSCEALALGEYWRAVANCENLSTPQEQSACKAQALADLADVEGACDDQYDERLVICQALGGGIYDPLVDPANFVAVIDNPYLPLTPGTTLVYEGMTAEGLEHNEFEVLSETKVILGVTCTVVRDTVSIAGELVEDTFDWFAQDVEGNVWYFGENSKDMEDGLIVSLHGSWTAGVDGAKPGIVMRAQPSIGVLYRQESALGIAEDVARLLSVDESVSVGYGSFANCWKTEDFTASEPGVVEHKFYAPGIGSVRTINLDSGESVELIDILQN